MLAAALNTLLVSYLANTWMICLITGNPMKVMLAARAVQLAVMLPLQSLVLLWLSRSGFIRGILEDARR